MISSVLMLTLFYVLQYTLTESSFTKLHPTTGEQLKGRIGVAATKKNAGAEPKVYLRPSSDLVTSRCSPNNIYLREK